MVTAKGSPSGTATTTMVTAMMKACVCVGGCVYVSEGKGGRERERRL